MTDEQRKRCADFDKSIGELVLRIRTDSEYLAYTVALHALDVIREEAAEYPFDPGASHAADIATEALEEVERLTGADP